MKQFKKLSHKGGFTLIEIIVVLIIVGILAAIALPNLFSNVVKSKGAEAVTSFGPMKALLEACGQKNQTYAGCQTTVADDLGAHNNFKYALADTCTDTSAPLTTTSYCIEANPNGLSGATAGTDYITFTQPSVGGEATCEGFGKFAGTC